MTTIENRAPIDMTAVPASRCHYIIEFLREAHEDGSCWCEFQNLAVQPGMRWALGDPAPRFGPDGLR